MNPTHRQHIVADTPFKRTVQTYSVFAVHFSSASHPQPHPNRISPRLFTPSTYDHTQHNHPHTTSICIFAGRCTYQSTSHPDIHTITTQSTLIQLLFASLQRRPSNSLHPYTIFLQLFTPPIHLPNHTQLTHPHTPSFRIFAGGIPSQIQLSQTAKHTYTKQTPSSLIRITNHTQHNNLHISSL